MEDFVLRHGHDNIHITTCINESIVIITHKDFFNKYIEHINKHSYLRNIRNNYIFEIYDGRLASINYNNIEYFDNFLRREHISFDMIFFEIYKIISAVNEYMKSYYSNYNENFYYYVLIYMYMNYYNYMYTHITQRKVGHPNKFYKIEDTNKCDKLVITLKCDYRGTSSTTWFGKKKFSKNKPLKSKKYKKLYRKSRK